MKLSICCITYNHEKFIREAIDSFLMQKTDFDFEIVIGEDFSTDHTRQICEEYAVKYPDNITLLPSERNWGMMPNFIRTLNACKGEYIAVCEGDDYWTDPLKLQKQVNFLEVNLNCNLITTNAEILTNISISPFLNKNIDEFFTFSEQILGNRCITCTVMFRRESLIIDGNLLKNLKIGDIFIYAIVLRSSVGYYLSDITARYRIHQGGVYSSISNTKKILNEIDTYKTLSNSKLFNSNENALIQMKLQYLWYDLLVNHKSESTIKSVINIVKNVNFSRKQSVLIVIKSIIRLFYY